MLGIEGRDTEFRSLDGDVPFRGEALPFTPLVRLPPRLPSGLGELGAESVESG